jgi:hypothetical protein
VDFLLSTHALQLADLQARDAALLAPAVDRDPAHTKVPGHLLGAEEGFTGSPLTFVTKPSHSASFPRVQLYTYLCSKTQKLQETATLLPFIHQSA